MYVHAVEQYIEECAEEEGGGDAFTLNGDFISPDGHFLRMITGELKQVDSNAWIRLVTAVYYSKFRSKGIAYTYNLICSHTDSPRQNACCPHSLQRPLSHRSVLTSCSGTIPPG